MKKKQTLQKILVVDDSVETIELIQRNLESAGYQVYTASSVSAAISLLDSVEPHLVITDLRMPEEDGLHLVRHVRENYKGIGVLVITGYPSIQGAIESIKEGAEEYLVKSFTDKELFDAVDRALDKVALVNKGKTINPISPNHSGLIGESPAMQEVYKTIMKIQSSQATVLITGESGTGKELVARAIHYKSQAPMRPFVPVNCGGIPDSLLESELFGHVRGSFTGANETRQGFFQVADGGTIFLDEVSNTSLTMQAKLLRVLQDKEFYMVGSKKPHKTNARIIAATNVELAQLIRQKLFREDLYYRLNVITINLPPLRERGNDIIMLANYFISRYAQEAGNPSIKISDKALSLLKNYAWPGNVRELQNLMHRMVIMCEDPTIDVPDLPESLRFTAVKTKGIDRTLEDVEQEHIAIVLAASKNNISRAAEVLGIDRKTLREKLKKVIPK